MENRIKLLAKWLNDVDTSTFSYDSYRSGRLESEIAHAQVEVCNKIGDYLTEILQMDKEQLRDNLEN
tara:strand:+ start:648 stop:848 length:201 start_codon:yes stop_codon:yes gene_type:complete